MSEGHKMNRRDFIKLSAAVVGGGLSLSIALPGCSSTNSHSDVATFRPSAWLTISKDEGVTILVSKSEMGQGVMTSLPMLIAEELEVSLDAIVIERAPLTPEFGYQITGGSTSIRDAWQVLRQAGATARSMLVEAGAKTWGVPSVECQARQGVVLHASTGRSLTYGELAELAAQLPVPSQVTLKQASEFKLIGKKAQSTDGFSKIDGSAKFGVDVNLPDMLFATIKHCPVFGGALKDVDDTKAKLIPGVKYILPVANGVAVVADNTWAAFRGREALHITWDEGASANLNSQDILTQYIQLAEEGAGEVMHETMGDTSPVAKRISAAYEVPFQAHAPMEPMSCTAFVREGECDVWVGTQSPTKAQRTAAEYAFSGGERLLNKIKVKLGGSLDDVRIHPTLIGGSFGRRLEQDYVMEAVLISKSLGKPIKLLWPREEDIQHDFYRPFSYHSLSGGVDERGVPVLWQHHIVSSNKGKTVEGAAKSYAIANTRVTFTQGGHGVPTGFWRSVGNSINGFVTECFVDELATAAEQDPYDFRMKLLDSNQSGRERAVLQLVAEKAGWLPLAGRGRYQGLAFHSCYGSHIAQVAEISMTGDQAFKIHKITCAVDCGTVVNPDTVRAQIEGGVVFGLTAAIKSHITINNGRVEQSNFHDFPILRMDEMPEVDVFIVDSHEAPSGIGELSVPPVAAAVANALYAATGRRVRRLPMITSDFSAAV